MEIFYAAKKRAEDEGDAKALEWFNKVRKKGWGGYFYIVAGENSGSGTALHEAADDQALEAARRLLEANADVDAVDRLYGGTPLHFAAFQGHAELIKMLLEVKADPCARDGTGRTPVDWTKISGLPSCFREAGLQRLVEMEGGRSRSDAQVVLKPVVSPTAQGPVNMSYSLNGWRPGIKERCLAFDDVAVTSVLLKEMPIDLLFCLHSPAARTDQVHFRLGSFML